MEIDGIQVDALKNGNERVYTLRVRHPAWFAPAYVCRTVQTHPKMWIQFHCVPSGLPLNLGTHVQYVQSIAVRFDDENDSICVYNTAFDDDDDDDDNQSNATRILKKWEKKKTSSSSSFFLAF